MPRARRAAARAGASEAREGEKAPGVGGSVAIGGEAGADVAGGEPGGDDAVEAGGGAPGGSGMAGRY